MKNLLLIACALAVGIVAGCGGGGGAAATDPDSTTEIVLPAGVTASQAYTVVDKTAGELPSAPAGSAFVAGAVASPEGVTFSGGQAILTFTLEAPLAAGETVSLFRADAQGNWTNISGVTISANRLVLTAPITSISGSGYAVFKTVAQ